MIRSFFELCLAYAALNVYHSRSVVFRGPLHDGPLETSVVKYCICQHAQRLYTLKIRFLLKTIKK